MAGKGDVELVQNWRSKHSINDIKKMVEDRGLSAISVGSFGFAALKKFDYQLEAHHCHKTSGYNNTFYIWHKKGGNQSSG